MAVRIERREFLQTAVASTAGTLMAGGVAFASPVPKTKTEEKVDPVAMVPLGKELKACRIS